MQSADEKPACTNPCRFRQFMHAGYLNMHFRMRQSSRRNSCGMFCSMIQLMTSMLKVFAVPIGA